MPIIPNILSLLERESRYSVIQQCAYAFAEIAAFNFTDQQNQIDDTTRNQIMTKLKEKRKELELNLKNQKTSNTGKLLKNIKNYTNTEHWIEIAIKNIEGVQLSEEEKDHLFAFRAN